MAKEKQSDPIVKKYREDLQRKINHLEENLTVGNFEQQYREISQLRLKLDRISGYKDHTMRNQIDWNVKLIQ